MCAAAGRHERPCRRSPQSGPEEGIWPPLPRIPHGNQFLRPETHLGSPGRLPLVWRLRGDLRPQHLLQQSLQPSPWEGVVSEPGCQAHEGSWLPQEPERSGGWRSLGRSRDLRDGAPSTQLSQEKLRSAGGGKGLAPVTVSPATSLKARALLHMAATCPWPSGGPLSTGLQPCDLYLRLSINYSGLKIPQGLQSSPQSQPSPFQASQPQAPAWPSRRAGASLPASGLVELKHTQE